MELVRTALAHHQRRDAQEVRRVRHLKAGLLLRCSRVHSPGKNIKKARFCRSSTSAVVCLVCLLRTVSLALNSSGRVREKRRPENNESTKVDAIDRFAVFISLLQH